jgi:predicted transcriptional regulator
MCYSPQIKGDLIKRLYQLKQKEKKSMTKMVNEAVTDYLTRKEKDETNKQRMA